MLLRNMLRKARTATITLSLLSTTASCTPVQHFVAHHSPLAPLNKQRHQPYYSCPQCGRLSPTGAANCKCLAEPAFYGYRPTCWQEWPEEWLDCPTQLEEVQMPAIEDPLFYPTEFDQPPLLDSEPAANAVEATIEEAVSYPVAIELDEEEDERNQPDRQEARWESQLFAAAPLLASDRRPAVARPARSRAQVEFVTRSPVERMQQAEVNEPKPLKSASRDADAPRLIEPPQFTESPSARPVTNTSLPDPPLPLEGGVRPTSVMRHQKQPVPTLLRAFEKHWGDQ